MTTNEKVAMTMNMPHVIVRVISLHILHLEAEKVSILRLSILEQEYSPENAAPSFSQNNSQTYINSYNEILNESKRRKLEPGIKLRKSINYESGGNNVASNIQQYLNKSRRKAEMQLPQNYGKSHSPAPLVDSISTILVLSN